jgi:hypothetical protein
VAEEELNGDALATRLLLDAAVQGPAALAPEDFPDYSEVRFVRALDGDAGSGGVLLDTARRNPNAVHVPPGWVPRMLERQGLVALSDEGRVCACAACGLVLVPCCGPPAATPAATATATATGALWRCLQHLAQCGGAHACADCGAWDYRLAQATIVKTASAAHRAALLLPDRLLTPMSVALLPGGHQGAERVRRVCTLVAAVSSSGDSGAPTAAAAALCVVCYDRRQREAAAERQQAAEARALQGGLRTRTHAHAAQAGRRGKPFNNGILFAPAPLPLSQAWSRR